MFSKKLKLNDYYNNKFLFSPTGETALYTSINEAIKLFQKSSLIKIYYLF